MRERLSGDKGRRVTYDQSLPAQELSESLDSYFVRPAIFALDYGALRVVFEA